MRNYGGVYVEEAPTAGAPVSLNHLTESEFSQ